MGKFRENGTPTSSRQQHEALPGQTIAVAATKRVSRDVAFLQNLRIASYSAGPGIFQERRVGGLPALASRLDFSPRRPLVSAPGLKDHGAMGLRGMVSIDADAPRWDSLSRTIGGDVGGRRGPRSIPQRHQWRHGNTCPTARLFVLECSLNKPRTAIPAW